VASATCPILRAVSALKRWAPPYTVCTGCRRGGSPGYVRVYAWFAFVNAARAAGIREESFAVIGGKGQLPRYVE
jgi:hypothetical protein